MDSSPIEDSPERIKTYRYYVYELIDFTDQESPKVFYVGKGVGSRVENHAKIVLEKLKKGTPIVDDKEVAIGKLLRSSGDALEKSKHLLELVIGRYETEAEALAVEAMLIQWVYGLTALSNKVRGHGASHVRHKGNLSPSADFQPRAYTRTRQENIVGAGIPDLAETLCTELTDLGFSNLSTGMFSGMEYGLYWKLDEHPVEVQIKFQESGTDVVLNARPSLQRAKNISKDDRQNNHAKFCDLMHQAGYKISAEYRSEKTFSALFESTRKSKARLNDDGRSLWRSRTGKDIAIYTSLPKGLPVDDIVGISSHLIDLQIRLFLTKPSIDESLRNRIVRLFLAKPASKFVGRNDLSKHLIGYNLKANNGEVDLP